MINCFSSNNEIVKPVNVLANIIFRQLLDPVEIPVFSLPNDIHGQSDPSPRPMLTQSFRSSLPNRSPFPFRVYKAPPIIKQSLLPFNFPPNFKITKTVNFESTPQKPQPMTASHDVQQPIIEWDTQDDNG